MGCILYYYDDDLREFGSSLERSDSLDDFPGISVVYMRLAWSLVEPKSALQIAPQMQKRSEPFRGKSANPLTQRAVSFVQLCASVAAFCFARPFPLP